MAPPTPRHSSPSPSSTTKARIQPRLQLAPQVNGIQLVSPPSLDKKFQPIFPYQRFNAVQSSCFPCVYQSSYNVVVAAPTGSGKTAIFELAICKLLATRAKKDFKIVYLAPTKALCAERTRDWQNKFKPLGLQVAEFTGDTSAAEVGRVRTATVIITTPEKWDSITRKWSDHGALLKTIKLVLIDEVHILKDTRGATLETVVSRMKTLSSEVRFVALSATVPNSTDIAQWLGLTHTSPQVPAKTLVYGDEFRPVRLDKIVIGYNVGGGNEHSLDSLLDGQLPNLIVKHAQGKPVLVFCFTRKSTESAAAALKDYWSRCSPTNKPWPGPAVTIRSSAGLRDFVANGVAFHHGGLERQDRTSIEEAFLHGHLSIVYCTSTLAVGVNLPCHTVILKGTMGYQNGKICEYDEFDVMQMIGRAGRPQFDTSATAIILTRSENRAKYLNIESGCQPVESTLHLNLTEHLNSEIVLGTVTSLAKAVQWLRGTFLAVRLRQNPDHYKLTDETTHARTTDEQLEEICKVGIARLADVGLIQYVDGSDSEFKGTQYGSAMSTYMVRFETMVMMLGLPKSMTMEELVNSLCRASEFDELRIKSTERICLQGLNESEDIPFKLKGNIMETWQKISVLIQVELSRGVLPYQQGMALMAKQAIERMQRLLESYIVCMLADNNGHGAKVALEFSRSLMARAWEGHVAQLCQIPDIGPVNMKKLADRQVTNVLDLAGLSTMDIERFLSKNPPAAMKIADTLKSFPLVDCIDLSAADEAETDSVHAPPHTKRKRPQESSSRFTSTNDPYDSYAFQSMSVKKPRKCSGGGTQQDPLTLDDDTSSDDFDMFDTDIFDDIEMPVIKESPEKPALKVPTRTPPAPVFKMCNVVTPTDEETVPGTRRSSPEPVEPVEPMEPMEHVVAEKGTGNGAVIAHAFSKSPIVPAPPAAHSAGHAEPCAQVFGGNRHIEEQSQTVDDDRNATDTKDDKETEVDMLADIEEIPNKSPAPPPKELSEPSWVTLSSSSIVDFLRGHVKFV
ncbi:ATP-dependent DNA helicase MER3 [Sporothrix curviconia]|uniref:DNA 3'-5' helicase n=1 Tax=Sporothrix curviconia TaxID=1260050 RepID=A0ABP0CC07_9PEZI